MGDGKDCDKILQPEEVLEILKANLGGNFRLLNYTIKPAADNLTGFLGEHYKIKAEVEIGGRIKKLGYFLKRMPSTVPEHREYAEKTKAFYKEVELYKTLFKDLKNAQEGMENYTKWCPEYYYSRGSELFVLEDLTLQGYYMYPERCYMDEDHIKVSLKAMAAMHSASLVFEEKFKEGKVDTLSPEFKAEKGRNVKVGEIYQHLTFETEASDIKGHPGNSYCEAGIKGQVKIIDFLSGYTEEEKQIIREKLPNVMRSFLQMVKTSNRFKNVFLHGDLWSNNLLYRKDGLGKVKDALIVDFQLARYAPPAHDVMMFLHLVQSKQFRKENQQRLLEFYYASFKEELEKNNLSAEALLPWDTFVESCDFYNDLGVLAKLYYFQFTVAPPEVTTKFLTSVQLFMKTMLSDRTDMVLECFLNDELYRSRVTEAVHDVIRRFILH